MEWKPFFYSVMALIFLGVILPLIITPFLSPIVVDESSLISPFVDLVATGVDLGLIEFNPFSWLGDTLHGFLLVTLINLSVFPNWFIASIMILILLGVLYTIARLIRG